MRRWHIKPALLAVVTATAAVAVGAPAVAAPNAPAPGADARIAAQVRAVMATMSLTDKVEQMFVSYVYGTSATVTDAADVTKNQALYGPTVTDGTDLLTQYHLGGIIYFTWANGLTDPQAIGTLSNGLQHVAMSGANPIPLQISTDQGLALRC